MRSLVATFLFTFACAPNTRAVDNTTSHPTPETGGFRAPQPAYVEWVELGTPVPTAPLQQTLEVPPNVGPISQLMVQGRSGESRISQIIVHYADQQERSIELRKVFGAGDGQVIELREARPIAKVTLFVDPDSKGSVVVYGG